MSRRRSRTRSRRRGTARTEASPVAREPIGGAIEEAIQTVSDAPPHALPSVTSDVMPLVAAVDTPLSNEAATAKKRGRATLETSAGGVVYRVHNGQPLFLLIRDSYRNWGFPKGHLEVDELPAAAALREVTEETGLHAIALDGEIETIDWFFRFRGKLVHKVCHFYLMHSTSSNTKPQRAEGITACRWAPYDEAAKLVSYANARDVLRRAHAMVQRGTTAFPTPTETSSSASS
ncbi:MAG: NUDIX hydrolase [Gemmatimonadaceae bacterium]|nr:NUDIX hydrolase [Gemmatimonadaceae bacterium]